ncbi:MAG: RidA family protein [Acidobacteriota bacterium]
MIRRLNPETVRAVPETFRGIYTHAVEITSPERLLLISGQIGLDRDGVTPPTFDAQCHQAMDNVEAILAAAGLSTADILKVTYYLTSAGHLPALTAIRQQRWASSEHAPAVTTLVVSELATPDLQIEIEVTAGR